MKNSTKVIKKKEPLNRWKSYKKKWKKENKDKEESTSSSLTYPQCGTYHMIRIFQMQLEVQTKES